MMQAVCWLSTGLTLGIARERVYEARARKLSLKEGAKFVASGMLTELRMIKSIFVEPKKPDKVVVLRIPAGADKDAAINEVVTQLDALLEETSQEEQGDEVVKGKVSSKRNKPRKQKSSESAVAGAAA